jgi:hypothetical protein
MLTNVPLTGITTLVATLSMGAAYLFISEKLKHAPSASQLPVRRMHLFFLYLAIFTGLMTLPFAWFRNAENFSLAAAYGYVIGHIFMYIAFTYIALMVCAIVPRLNRFARPVSIIWFVAAAVLTVINTKTMIFGVRPVYDSVHQVILYQASPIVGAGIGIFAGISTLPAVILFVVSAMKAHGARRAKSLIIATGFLLIMTAGPLHDLARTGSVYAIADVFTILGMLVLGFGVVFQIETGLSTSSVRRSVMAAPSNTV